MIYTVSIEGRCRHCGSVFSLRDLLLERTGRCPACEVLLSPDWTGVLLEEATTAEQSQDRLIGALRRLVGLPGQMEVLPGSLIRNLFDEIGWDEELKSDPEIVERELRLMRQELQAWERLQPGDGRRLAKRLHQLARGVRRLSASPPARHPRPADGGLDGAADSLDDQAEQLASRRASPDSVLASLDRAADLVHHERRGPANLAHDERRGPANLAHDERSGR